MKKKIWFYLCIVQAVIIVAGLILTVAPPKYTVDTEDVDLRAYVDSFHADNNCLPDVGYIPDAETASVVGSVIIDKITGRSRFGATTVTYDEENRLWMVERGYLFAPGGFVVIEQDTGRVIKMLLEKF